MAPSSASVSLGAQASPAPHTRYSPGKTLATAEPGTISYSSENYDKACQANSSPRTQPGTKAGQYQTNQQPQREGLTQQKRRTDTGNGRNRCHGGAQLQGAKTS